MFLVDLPIDLLSVITAPLHYLDVVNLWMSGSSHLNAKFAKGGVAQLVVDFRASLRRFSWPSFLYALPHLARLIIKESSFSPDLPPIDTSLIATWSNIKDLSLLVPGTFPAFQSLLLADRDSFPALRALTLAVYPEEWSDDDTHALWPRFLASLNLQPQAYAQVTLNVATLPSQLTELKGEFHELANPTNGTFPASLTSIQIGLDSLECDPVPLLPIGLQTFQMFAMSTLSEDPDILNEWALRSIRLLPHTLKRLELDIQKMLSTHDLRDLGETVPNLTYLEAGPMSSAAVEALPRSLTRCPNFCYTMTTDMLQHLPRGMKQVFLDPLALLHFKPVDNVSVTVSASYDPDTTDFEEEISNLQTPTLSPFITALSFKTSANFRCEIVPSTLTSLTLGNGSCSANQLAALPLTLSKLALHSLDPRCWKLLPSRLHHLRLYVAPVLPIESSSWLPATLNLLNIFDCEEIPPAWLSGLPASLRFLRVPLHLDKTSAPFAISIPSTLTIDIALTVTFPRDQFEARNALHEIVLALPPLLQQFSIHNPTSLPILASTISSLPKRLTFLKMPGHTDGVEYSHGTIPNPHLLPRSLTYASFGGVQIRNDTP